MINICFVGGQSSKIVFLSNIRLIINFPCMKQRTVPSVIGLIVLSKTIADHLRFRKQMIYVSNTKVCLHA